MIWSPKADSVANATKNAIDEAMPMPKYRTMPRTSPIPPLLSFSVNRSMIAEMKRG